jgi:hypothetical protein
MLAYGRIVLLALALKDKLLSHHPKVRKTNSSLHSIPNLGY